VAAPDAPETAESGFGLAKVRDAESRPLEEWITQTLVDQLHGEYGWKESEARAYAAEYLTGRREAGTVDRLENLRPLEGCDVLEVGSGLGGALLELRRRGVRAIGVEPSGEWCGIIRRRLRQKGLPEGCVVQATGEHLPFEDASADVVFTLQVLEHVDEPERVMAEIDRVLRPGGRLYISAPNYFSFSENHYNVFWLPGLTHRTGSWYLRAIGRDPAFFRKHVNNLTYPQVIRAARKLGWKNLKLERRLDRVRGRKSLASNVAKAGLKLAPGVWERLYHASKLFRSDMNLLFEKPAAAR
jgi:SAM-dependent methyltransferase